MPLPLGYEPRKRALYSNLWRFRALSKYRLLLSWAVDYIFLFLGNYQPRGHNERVLSLVTMNTSTSEVESSARAAAPPWTCHTF
jgi:hypothetical protein